MQWMSIVTVDYFVAGLRRFSVPGLHLQGPRFKPTGFLLAGMASTT